MANKNFEVKHGLSVGGTERISSAGVITGSLASATTATTQSALDNSTKIATTAYTDAAITAVIGGAPGTLDTLNELAAAINDDASYASTLTTALGTKLPLAGGTLTGALIVVDGSTSSPSIGNSGDTNTGIYFPADDQMGLVAGGSRKLLISSTGLSVTNGDLTIGSGGVDISGTDELRYRMLNNGTFKGGIEVVTTNGDMITTSVVDDLAIRSESNILFSGGGNTERLRLNSTGGIISRSTGANYATGTVAGLFVDGASRGTVRIRSEIDAAAELFFDVDGGASWDISARQSSDNYDLHFYNRVQASDTLTAVAGPTVVFTQSGRVGIGTNNPLVKLDVMGSPSAPASSGTAQTGSLRVSQSVGNGVLDMGFWTSSNGTSWLQSTNKTNLATNYDLALQPNGGNVGIGLTEPLNRFVVAHQSHGVAIDYVGATLPAQAGLFTSSTAHTQTAYGDLNIKARSDYGPNYGIGFFTSSANNAPTRRMRINAAGDVQLESGALNKGYLQLSTQSNLYALMGGNHWGYLGYKTGGYHRWFGSDGAEKARISGTTTGRLLVSGSTRGRIVTQNETTGDGDDNCGAILANDYSSWSTIFSEAWLGNSSGWGTFWAGSSGALYRKDSGDTNPNELVFVGSGNKRMTFDLNPGGNVYFDGTLGQNAYDYAEYFEWEDGNPDNEDRRGFTVVLAESGLIRKATSDDDPEEIMGAISGTAAVLGDAAIYDWDGKYEIDEWGTRILDDVVTVSWVEIDDNGEQTNHSYKETEIPAGITVPEHAGRKEHKEYRLTADYDPEQEYVPRERRPEWGVVGLLGKVRIRDESPKNPRWKYIKTIAGKKLWLIR